MWLLIASGNTGPYLICFSFLLDKWKPLDILESLKQTVVVDAPFLKASSKEIQGNDTCRCNRAADFARLGVGQATTADL